MLERFRDRTRFWIELKAGSDPYPGIEERVVASLEIYDVLDRALIQSFDHAALRRARGLSREVRLGALMTQLSLDPAVVAPGLVQAICPGVDGLTERDVALIREAGLGCYVWTVNEPALMDRLVSWGVSGIITDGPALLRARLHGR